MVHADLMTAAFHVHPLNLACIEAVGITQLRLVSKEIGKLDVTSIEYGAVKSRCGLSIPKPKAIG